MLYYAALNVFNISEIIDSCGAQIINRAIRTYSQLGVGFDDSRKSAFL